MKASRDFDPQDPLEIESFTFDFVNDLPNAQSIVASPWPTVTIEVMEGTDATPSDRLKGAPTFGGTQVHQMVGNCVAGVTYKLTATVTTSSGQAITLWALIPKEPDVS